jgi:type III secretion protein V
MENKQSLFSLMKEDIVVPIFLVAIIFIIILPLPTWLVDSFIAINMTIGVLLLMTAVRLSNPLDFAIFPSILLITTIFRLALSITTTRLILLNGDAGEIIEVFGQFVVGGNVIVGLVIFLIITIVQFMVITKGAERVAEVSARFSLDAMPGKQMSIDADLRAGSIDTEEAQKRRNEVGKESKLYGSMDGAMKFVKGDAIAGLIITMVNIIGGVAIGVLQKGISAGDALAIYTVLTIGDGLISQIPALFISISAGIIVTRVTDEQKTVLGKDIRIQLLNKPNTTILVALIMLGFGLIPGFPTGIFILISAGLIVYTQILRRTDTKKSNNPNTMRLAPNSGFTPIHLDIDSKEGSAAGFTLTQPLMVEMSDDLRSSISIKDAEYEITSIRQALLFDLGVPFPSIDLEFRDDFPDGEYVIRVHEAPVARGKLIKDHLCVKNQENMVETLGLEIVEGSPFRPRDKIVWLDKQFSQTLQENNISVLTPQQFLAYHVAHTMRQHVKEFLGLQEVSAILDETSKLYRELVAEATKSLPLPKITQVLQRLAAEGISIRNMRSILSSIIEWSQSEKDPLILCEYVRIDLSRAICGMHTDEGNVLPVHMINQDIERIIRDGIRQSAQGSYLDIDPTDSTNILSAILDAVGPQLNSTRPPVLVTSLDVRRYIKKMLETELFDVSVLSFQEVDVGVNVQPLSQISLKSA